MEELLDVYERDYDPQNPVICFDERPSQLIGDVIMPIAMKSGKVQRQDHHYKRNGKATLNVPTTLCQVV